VGRVQEKTSLSKMRPMFDTFSTTDIESKLPGQQTGEFHLISERKIQSIKADRSLLNTEQLADSEIIKLAKNKPPKTPPDSKSSLFTITCPNCGEKRKIIKNKNMKKVKCMKCKWVWTVE